MQVLNNATDIIPSCEHLVKKSNRIYCARSNQIKKFSTEIPFFLKPKNLENPVFESYKLLLEVEGPYICNERLVFVKDCRKFILISAKSSEIIYRKESQFD